MKYGIVENITDLQSCTLAKVTIAPNPLLILKKSDRSHLRLIQIEDEAPEGNYECKMLSGKLQLQNGDYYGFVTIDLNNHLIEFDPDANYEVFGSGYAREVKNPLQNNSFESSDKGFLLVSPEEAPATWERTVLSTDELDWNKIIPVSILK